MRRHDLDVVSLVAGVAFAGLAVAWLLYREPGLGLGRSIPILLVVIGIAGLLAVRSQAGRDHDADPELSPPLQ